MQNRLLRLFQIFSAKLVLEVFGGAGAIWGFSEAVGFRKPDTVWFWRPCALTFGVIFFFRWMMQINDYLVDTRVSVKEYNDDSETLELTDGQGESSSYGSAEGGKTSNGTSIIV